MATCETCLGYGTIDVVTVSDSQLGSLFFKPVHSVVDCPTCRAPVPPVEEAQVAAKHEVDDFPSLNFGYMPDEPVDVWDQTLNHSNRLRIKHLFKFFLQGERLAPMSQFDVTRSWQDTDFTA